MSARTKRLAGVAAFAIGAAALMTLLLMPRVWLPVLTWMFPGQPDVLYTQTPLVFLTLRHIEIVLLASALTIAIGIPLGIFATRPAGRDFRDLIAAAVDFGQTFPPVAVLAIMVPVLGFSLGTVITALFLYGLFPVVSNTVAGIEAVPPSVLDSARGMGMGPWRVLFVVELPLSARVIMAGVRNSVIITIGTATVAAFVGVGGLGDPILGGINVLNMAWVLQGAVVAAALAILTDAGLALVESALTPAGTRA